MSGPVSDPWAALTPRDAQSLLSGLPIRWWIAGGWALDLEGRWAPIEWHLDFKIEGRG